MSYWYQKSLLDLSDHSAAAVEELLALSARLKREKQSGQERRRLQGKNVVLIFEKTSTRTRCAFEVACADQGAFSTFLAAENSQMGDKESIADTARVLGRMYDAIEYRGFSQETVQTLEKFAQVPVYNGLTDLSHPTQMLADLLTMQEHSGKPLQDTAFAYFGDARFNMGNSLLLAGALMGMDVRIAAPKAYQPKAEILRKAEQLAAASGARILISEDAKAAARGADFIHTDIWLSMGEEKSAWEARTAALMPYRITPEIMQTAGAQAKFMHCLPAYHDRKTPLGEAFYRSHTLVGIEVADNVFESAASVVFDQAENRMHTIKALLVATLCETVQG